VLVELLLLEWFDRLRLRERGIKEALMRVYVGMDVRRKSERIAPRSPIP
jgi:hypothetical protein